MHLDFHMENLFAAFEHDGKCTGTTDTNLQGRLRSLAKRELLIVPFPALYLRTDYAHGLSQAEITLHVMRSLHDVHPDWVFSHLSAALLHDFEVPYELLRTIHTTTSLESHFRNTPALQRHFMHSGLTHEITEANGIPATAALRTVFDCARFYPFDIAMIIADSALRLQRITACEALAFCAAKKGFKGVQRALTVLSYATASSENGGESRTKARIIELGYMPPEQQVDFRDDITGNWYRTDFLWHKEDGSTVIMEFHGRKKYTDPAMTGGQGIDDVLTAEEKRASRLSLHNIVMIDVDYTDIMNYQGLNRILARYGVPKRPGARPWRVEFNRRVGCAGA